MFNVPANFFDPLTDEELEVWHGEDDEAPPRYPRPDLVAAGRPGLSHAASAAIRDAEETWVSAISALEVTTKVRNGKLAEAEYIARRFEEEVANEDFRTLSMSARHGHFAGSLLFAGRDPLDRTLIAQAILENLILVSNERLFDSTGVSRIW